MDWPLARQASQSPQAWQEGAVEDMAWPVGWPAGLLLAHSAGGGGRRQTIHQPRKTYHLPACHCIPIYYMRREGESGGHCFGGWGAGWAWWHGKIMRLGAGVVGALPGGLRLLSLAPLLSSDRRTGADLPSHLSQREEKRLTFSSLSSPLPINALSHDSLSHCSLVWV